ncbi:hypothetical protein Ssi02_26270 [Sinosporangium siamense]|uniref:Uncharacterized protein n=1 Tax=Sinosporangium siamense TaxID=1367973 RepID=A0A919RI46_9ACTN|nr:hypothetical protein Ssi02_26270 [Sinosporangium siamense]
MIAHAVSSPLSWVFAAALCLAITYLGLLSLIRGGGSHRVESIEWKNRLIGELKLTYSTDGKTSGKRGHTHKGELSSPTKGRDSRH